MTTISALISQCRREYDDIPKSVRVSRQGNGTINLFNTGKYPIVENSYVVYVGGVQKTENTDYTINLDSGDINISSTPSNGTEVRLEGKIATWRDKNWVEALNQGIESLNARGFFRQVVRESFTISANVRTFSGPSACVDLYELLYAPAVGSVSRLPQNWSYQQDANKIILGSPFTTQAYTGYRSYLRNLQKYNYSSTSGAVDALDDWVEIIKKKSGSNFYRSLAGKVAKQGNATIDEGHFSFTNLRTMAKDLDDEFERLAARKKPTRPAKELQSNDPTAGVA